VQPSPPSQSFDEFERALEEDFRRSVNEPVQQRRENISEVQIQSASDAEDMSRARSMKRMLAAAAVIVVFGGVAYAGYSFLMRDGSLGIASGEPRVIVADKEPVKVVPENPGGKTVPNQDKAVYDSVGGAAAEAPKQKALVSSDEQPVDVVQRTLTPETLPEDNDAPECHPWQRRSVIPRIRVCCRHMMPRRLRLPMQATPTSSPSVSARKVRTMIVKPDGTLVARDEPAPEGCPGDIVAAEADDGSDAEDHRQAGPAPATTDRFWPDGLRRHPLDAGRRARRRRRSRRQRMSSPRPQRQRLKASSPPVRPSRARRPIPLLFRPRARRLPLLQATAIPGTRRTAGTEGSCCRIAPQQRRLSRHGRSRQLRRPDRLAAV
jgi:hypothetical protein